MRRLVWLTDIHLDFCPAERVERFLSQVADADVEAILLGGDITEADRLTKRLREMMQRWQHPIYFVLGNHDFYGSSIRQTRSEITAFAADQPDLVYLTVGTPVDLGEGWCLVGHDGWADGRIGDYASSVVMMHDYRRIEELSGCTKRDRLTRLMELGDQAAEQAGAQLRAALQDFDHILMLTHVPPFREACWYEGQISNDEWAPHFTCQAMGEMIRQEMRSRPQKQLTVLCGHTHGDGFARPYPNVSVFTGASQYGEPAITGIIELQTERIHVISQ